jgi:hypothetical protein
MENGPFIDGLPICISLVGALEHGFYDFPEYFGNNPSQLTFIFFRGIGIPWYTTNQSYFVYERKSVVDQVISLDFFDPKNGGLKVVVEETH